MGETIGTYIISDERNENPIADKSTYKTNRETLGAYYMKPEQEIIRNERRTTRCEYATRVNPVRSELRIEAKSKPEARRNNNTALGL